MLLQFLLLSRPYGAEGPPSPSRRLHVSCRRCQVRILNITSSTCLSPDRTLTLHLCPDLTSDLLLNLTITQQSGMQVIYSTKVASSITRLLSMCRTIWTNQVGPCCPVINLPAAHKSLWWPLLIAQEYYLTRWTFNPCLDSRYCKNCNITKQRQHFLVMQGWHFERGSDIL